MQKVLKRENAAEAREALGEPIWNYVVSEECESFESHEHCNIIAFDWYDRTRPDDPQSKITICADKENLIVFCEGERAFKAASRALQPSASTERALYLFFTRMLRTDMAHLEAVESRINAIEERLMKYSNSECLMDILEFRYELFDLKRYYSQLYSIFEDCEENENEIFSEDGMRHFSILANRAERLLSHTVSLRDYVSQAREAYQAQTEIEQNALMRIFTVITAVFLPLTLLVGWYGMNFKYMPELDFEYAYPIFTGICLAIVITLVIIFKKRKWF